MRLNRKRLVVVLEDQIYIYDISNMNMLYTVDTSPNPSGTTAPCAGQCADVVAICALSSSSGHNYLVYPLPTKASPSYAPPSHAPPTSHIAPTSGEVLIFDATKMEAVNVVEAHHSPLSCIALNNDGTLLATASEKGTIVRVFSVPDARKLYQFRRGSIPAQIYSMSFNSTSTLLCVSSGTETVHIFRLARPGSRSNSVSDAMERSESPGSEDVRDAEEDVAETRPVNPSLAGMLRRTSQNVGKTFAATVGGYLPSAVAEMWEPSRDFAWVKIPRRASGPSLGPMRTVVALSNSGPQVMVVTSEGNFFVFNVDLERGGEGTLVKQFS